MLDYLKDYNNIGMCFDAGHYHCHFKDNLNWDYFKNKILCVHLHDNDGEDDRHWLPYHGNINWESVINNLKFANYNGPVVMEVTYRNLYTQFYTLQEFYNESFNRAKKLAEMLK